MEFTIGSVVYQTRKLDAFKQLHIVRRLTPCLGALASLADNKARLTHDADGKVTGVDGDIGEVMRPLADAITSLKDEDVEYILNACLEAVERRQGSGWAKMRVNGVTMFEGLTLPAMLAIAYHVIRDNLTDFFGDLPSLSGLEGFLKAKGLAG